MFPAPYRAPRRVLRWLKWRERRGLGFHCDLTAVYLELGGNPQERSVTQDRLWVLADWISTVREYSLRGTMAAIGARPVSLPRPDDSDDEPAPVEPIDNRLPAVMPNGPSSFAPYRRERQAA